MKWVASLAVLLVAIFPTMLPAADSVATNQLPKRIPEVYSLAYVDPQIIIPEVRNIVGPDGRVVHDAANSRLVVVATTEQQALIGDLITKLSTPPKNIQILVSIADANATVERGAAADVRGTVVAPQIERSTASGTIRFQDQTTQSARNSTQFITVMSGGRGSISVGEEVPFVDWFFDYGIRFGYLRTETRWRQVGANLYVEPRLVGDGKLIQVKLIPEFSYFIGNQRVTTAFANAATEVTVANGQEFHVGGSTGNQEFMSKFLIGYDRSRQHRKLDIVLKPTIME